MLMLFSWPLARSVRPNYDVVMFQPRSGTAPSLGSFVDVMSYINPVLPFNYLLDLFLSPSVS